MTDKISAAASGTFRLLGQRPVHRLGFGAMRITGQGIWGPPAQPAQARETLRGIAGLGIQLIDTADSYGPYISEDLLREELAPYKGLLVATKGGLTRHGPNIWLPVGRPEYLRQCVLMSLRRLGVERIDLWQLHRIDPKVPRDEQFGVMAEMQREGLIDMLGLSEVSVSEIQAAQKVFKVASVQNLYNLVERKSEDVVSYCEANDIAFIPWFPLAAGSLAQQPSSSLRRIAQKLNATTSQVALAWTLARSPVMLPIPGTSQLSHLEENVAAAALKLSPEDFKALDEEGRAAASSRN